MTYRELMRDFERRLIWKALLSNRGNQCRASKVLDIHRNTLGRRMADLGIDAAEVRAAARLVAEQVTP